MRYTKRSKFDKDPVHGSELLVRFTHRKRETIKLKQGIKSVVKDITAHEMYRDQEEEVKLSKGGF